VKFINVEIPLDYSPGEQSHNQILEDIRLKFSNYSGLSSNLPACPCPNNEAREFECPNRAIARDTLLWAANGLVELSYREWLTSKKS